MFQRESLAEVQIALISNFLPGPGSGGAERYAAMLADTLAQGGHEVTFYTGSDGDIPGVKCQRLPCMPELDPIAHRLRKATWHVQEQWLPTVHRALARALKANPPDVVHSHEPQMLSAAVFSAIASAHLPHVHTTHDFNLLCARVTMTKAGRPCGGSCLECRLQRTIRVGALQRRLDLLLAPSDFVRDRHLEHGVVSPQRAMTIRHGAAPGKRRLRRPVTGHLRVGFLGALSDHKGVPTLLRAAAAMPVGWSLAIAGAGPLADEVRAACANDRRIAFAGELDAAERDAFLDQLDVIVIPSEWEEPATLVAVEAAVRGLPAVVSNRGGLPETPQAKVFAAGDSQALLAALSELDRVPSILTSCSEALLNSSAAYMWSTHVKAVEAALGRAATRT
ncbi:MAG TPA: glycosyltransferase [Solirubrobacteraceae bacterium]|jgi:glycosyltransferase involved in cell wall biosynthesis